MPEKFCQTFYEIGPISNEKNIPFEDAEGRKNMRI